MEPGHDPLDWDRENPMTVTRGLVAALAVLTVWSSLEVLAITGTAETPSELLSSRPLPDPLAGACDPRALTSVWTPAAYVDLRDALRAKIDAFDSRIRSAWNGTRSPVAFATELSAASSHRGRDLLVPANYAGVLLELSRLDALGLRAVTVSISFPLLDSSFTTDPAEFQGYVNFYATLKSDVHARGMTFMVDSNVLFPSYTALPVQSYYNGLTFSEYQQGRLRNVLTIAQAIRPDYMGIGSEPDTEQMLTGQPVATPSAYTAHVNYLLSGLAAAGIQGLPIGAGIGTWDPSWFSYALSLSANTNLATIDFHIYPINFDFLDRAFSIVDIARAYGKGAAVSEVWLYKARDAELSQGVTYDAIFGRDAYSFFGLLDAKFLRAMVAFAHYTQLEYTSAFWEKYFFAYLDYNATIGMTPMEIQYYSNLAAVDAMLNGVYSDTGHDFAVAIDETPPTAPTNLAATAVTDTEVQLGWSASADDLGVWCYRIRRDGQEVAMTKGTTYTDTGRVPSTTYMYEVLSYDEAGNPSPPKALTVSTMSGPDTTSPTVIIVAPAHGSRLTSSSATVTGTASDDVGVTKVELSTDGTTWVVASGTTSWSAVVTLAVGTNVIRARATDPSGNVATAAVTVIVEPGGGENSGGQGASVLAGIVALVAVIALVYFVLQRRRKRPPEGEVKT